MEETEEESVVAGSEDVTGAAELAAAEVAGVVLIKIGGKVSIQIWTHTQNGARLGLGREGATETLEDLAVARGSGRVGWGSLAGVALIRTLEVGRRDAVGHVDSWVLDRVAVAALRSRISKSRKGV